MVSIPKVEFLENEKFLRNETTSNFQSGFHIFDDLLKKMEMVFLNGRRGLVGSVLAY